MESALNSRTSKAETAAKAENTFATFIFPFKVGATAFFRPTQFFTVKLSSKTEKIAGNLALLKPNLI